VNGANGTSGTSGNSGTSGSSGTSGTSGATGGSGTSGSSGTSGTSGGTGASGTSGSSGTSGTSGATGGSGTSGSSGTSGTSGATGGSGTSGTSGTSPSGGITGGLNAGYIPYATSSSSIADSPLYYDGANAYVYSEFSSQIIGLGLKYNAQEFYLGDFNGFVNGTYIGVDDGNADKRAILSAEYLDFPNPAILNASSLSYTNRNLYIKVNGVDYNIPLYN
jgi:hypothetical protein